MDEVVHRWGVPRKLLISDRGREFHNELFAELERVYKYRHIKISAVNPRSDGMAEAQRKPLKDSLVAYCNKYKDDWDWYLSLVAFTYCTTVNDATGYTPHFLMTGREATVYETDEVWKSRAPEKRMSEYAEGLVSVMSHLCKHVGEKLYGKVSHYNKRPIERLPFKPYQAGQYFYLRAVPRTTYIDPSDKQTYFTGTRLNFRFTGPYLITKVYSPVLYQALINNKQGGQCPCTEHETSMIPEL